MPLRNRRITSNNGLQLINLKLETCDTIFYHQHLSSILYHLSIIKTFFVEIN